MAEEKNEQPDWVKILETLEIDQDRKLSELLESEICDAVPGLGDLTVREALTFPSVQNAFRRRYELVILRTGHS
jgi:hypothetical protein